MIGHSEGRICWFKKVWEFLRVRSRVAIASWSWIFRRPQLRLHSWHGADSFSLLTPSSLRHIPFTLFLPILHSVSFLSFISLFLSVFSSISLFLPLFLLPSLPPTSLSLPLSLSVLFPSLSLSWFEEGLAHLQLRTMREQRWRDGSAHTDNDSSWIHFALGADFLTSLWCRKKIYDAWIKIMSHRCQLQNFSVFITWLERIQNIEIC